MHVFALAAKLIIFIVIGYAARKLKAMEDGFDRMLTKFIMSVPLPVMIINSFRIEFSARELLNLPIIIGMSVLTMAVCYGVGEIARRIIGGGRGKVARFGLTFTNFTFFGLSVVSELYGSQAVFYFVIFTMPIRIMFYGSAPIILGDGTQKLHAKQTAKQFLSPPIIAVFVGLFLYIAQIELPSVIDDVMLTVGNMASPLGLMLCGTIIADAKIRGVLDYPEVIVTSILRLLFMPAIALAIALALRLDKMIIKTIVLYFAMPVASFLPLFSLRYNPHDTDAIAMGSYFVAVSTILCVATIPLWAFLLEFI